MSYAAGILPEYDQEMASARKVLERLPTSKFEWRAHPKSHTIGWNANHLAEIRGFVLNHLIHHRAITCVYLRLNDIPVPRMYGPSGDE